MAIRINLLAEQQWTEEMRRKDPVKKAFWIGGGLVAVMVLWIVWLTLEQIEASHRLEKVRNAYLSKTNDFMQATNQMKINRDLEGKIKSLDKYATNRFLWANVLDELQHTTVTNVRMTKLVSVQTYVTNNTITFQTNYSFDLSPPKKWYNFGKGPPGTNVLPGITNVLNSLTNRPMFQTNRTDLIKSLSLKTNAEKTQVTAAMSVTRPPTMVEARTLVISGQDFSSTAGQQIFSLTNALLASPFFGRYLTVTNLSIDSSFQLQTDPLSREKGDFVVFSIYCNFPDTVRNNE